MKYTVAQFLSYVNGWLDSEAVKKDELTMENMIAALHNARITIDDPSDGIEQEVKRKCWMTYRFEKEHVTQFQTDNEAFEYALGWHDERDAYVEKWIDNKWCPAADPIRNPEHFENGKDGGWITNNGLVDYDS